MGGFLDQLAEDLKDQPLEGYRGRLAIHELMLVTEDIERMTVEHATTDELARVAVTQGMRPLRQDGLTKVARGDTSIEEILRVVV